jgi:lysophospholipid acyltransferase (LPLAT)-like uncharacterized protein
VEKKKRKSLSRRFRKSRFGTWLVTSLVKWGVRGLNGTLRLKWIDREIMDDLYRTKRNFIFAYWHSDLILASRVGIEELARHPIVVMTSQSRDGLLIAELLGSQGMKVILGSTKRGGMEAFMGFVRSLRSGMNGSIAVDGPRGPRREVKDGVIRLAQMSGAVILPCAVGYRRKVTLNSWDLLRVPIPFTQASVICDQPISIPPRLTEEEARSAATALQKTLVDLRKRLPFDRE